MQFAAEECQLKTELMLRSRSNGFSVAQTIDAVEKLSV
jgi:hypothetical protein